MILFENLLFKYSHIICMIAYNHQMFWLTYFYITFLKEIPTYN